MAAALLLISDRRFMRPKLLSTSGRLPHLLAKSCGLFNDGRPTNSNLLPSPTVGDIEKRRVVTFPTLFAAYHSFLISYPTKITVSPKEIHEVFFNFRGDQLRHNFVSHLCDAFERHGIKFFVDKDEQRGKDLKQLFVRIEQSSIALAIFSTRYPESTWCMDELVKMKKLADLGKLIVIPIFYNVKAQDVRRPTCNNEFGKNFWKLAEASSGDQIKNWKEALECISNKMGLTLEDKRSEADFIKEIVKEMQRVIEEIGLDEKENHCGEIKEKPRELQLPR